MKSFILNKVILLPYYLTLKLRHYMYDNGIFKSHRFDIPIISIGNLSVGGTGKTPHTELLLEHLLQEGRVAVLSRGYGRRTRGFRFVEVLDRAIDCGDEPLQIKRKYPEAIVAVDANRVRGIGRLSSLPPEERPKVIVLDDAFQHRRVIPTISILLIDYSKPPCCDNLLPFGRLRDLPNQMSRADVVIITKCPPQMSDEEFFNWRNGLTLLPNQKLFFSAVSYSEPIAIFEEGDKRYTYSNYAILVTGIANPKPLEYHVMDRYKIERRLYFSDHHNYKRRDARKINRASLNNPKAVIITTEKDAQRLSHLNDLSADSKKRIFYLPIKITVLNESAIKLFDLLSKSILG